MSFSLRVVAESRTTQRNKKTKDVGSQSHDHLLELLPRLPGRPGGVGRALLAAAQLALGGAQPHPRAADVVQQRPEMAHPKPFANLNDTLRRIFGRRQFFGGTNSIQMLAVCSLVMTVFG